MSQLVLVLCLLVPASFARAAQEDKVFSGPQPGEKLPPLKVVGAFDDLEGKELDLVKEAGKDPVLLVFVHEITRPSAALLRGLTAYAATRARDGLKVYLVWLHRDRTEASMFLKRARGSLNLKATVTISLDGAEGPGAYGLNRKVGLTVLVAKEGKVTANFALTQPAVSDGPKIAEAIVRHVGGKAPDVKAFDALAFGRPAASERDPKLVSLLRGVIRKDAPASDVTKAAAAVEDHVGDRKELLKQLGEIAAVCVKQGYGTEEAQKHLKVWADKYGPK
jgi:hypothetical protein